MRDLKWLREVINPLNNLEKQVRDDILVRVHEGQIRLCTSKSPPNHDERKSYKVG